MVRRKKRKYDDPILHGDHPRPRTRREFLSQGFILGGGSAVLGMSTVSIGGRAFALSDDLAPLVNSCGIATQGAGKVPFICFDLAGGSNQAGSNVLVGQQGGQLDFLSTKALVGRIVRQRDRSFALVAVLDARHQVLKVI